jgi:hypothetical protein
MKGTTFKVGVLFMMIVLAVGLFAFAAGCSNEDSDGESDGEVVTVTEGYSDDAVDLIRASDKLWDDFAFWAYNAIVAASLQQPNYDAAATRWLAVAEDLGAVVSTYYGADAGATFTDALNKLQTDAVALVTAVLSDDAAGQETATQALSEDIETIATFLDEANPEYWPYDTVLGVLQNILDYTVDTATAIITGSWEESVTAFDTLRDEIMVLAYTFSSGVVGQFPDDF